MAKASSSLPKELLQEVSDDSFPNVLQSQLDQVSQYESWIKLLEFKAAQLRGQIELALRMGASVQPPKNGVGWACRIFAGGLKIWVVNTRGNL